MLSGGMDSAILASYLPKGTIAYTLNFDSPDARNEISGASYFASLKQLDLRIININRHEYLNQLDELFESKGAPFHSIEPQILIALKRAKLQGSEGVIFGENADTLFGGFDRLLTYSNKATEFIPRYIYFNPYEVLAKPVDVNNIFKPFIQEDKIDIHRFISRVFAEEGLNSYLNPARAAQINCISPYSKLVLKGPLDINRVRNGENKYLIRELFNLRYPGVIVPDKLPMPRAIGVWLSNWQGPKNSVFKNLEMHNFSSDQKWMLFCAEKFLEYLERR